MTLATSRRTEGIDPPRGLTVAPGLVVAVCAAVLPLSWQGWSVVRSRWLRPLVVGGQA